MSIAIRTLHTAIYIVMVFAIGYVLYAGVVGDFNPTLLMVALGLVTLECVVFIGNGWKCPLTTMAITVGGGEATNYAPLVPPSMGRYTPGIFGTLFIFGLILLLVRWRFELR